MSLELTFSFARGGFSLEVDHVCAGITAVIGPIAAGKTTLLRACVGAVRPEAGVIRLAGRTLFDARGTDLPPEDRRVAYVPQGLGLFPHLDVLQNVAFARRYGTDHEARRAALRRLADDDLEHLADKLPRELSDDERLRVALIRALASDPELILLDEPFGAFEPHDRRRLRRAMAIWLNETDRPVLLATREALDASELADGLLVLEGGRVTQSGSIDEVAVRPATEYVAALTAGLIDRRPRSVPPRSLVSEDE